MNAIVCFVLSVRGERTVLCSEIFRTDIIEHGPAHFAIKINVNNAQLMIGTVCGYLVDDFESDRSSSNGIQTMASASFRLFRIQ